MQFNLSSYIRILKTNSKSASTSDESFVSELFDPFVVALGLKNKEKSGILRLPIFGLPSWNLSTHPIF